MIGQDNNHTHPCTSHSQHATKHVATVSTDAVKHTYRYVISFFRPAKHQVPRWGQGISLPYENPSISACFCALARTVASVRKGNRNCP